MRPLLLLIIALCSCSTSDESAKVDDGPEQPSTVSPPEVVPDTESTESDETKDIFVTQSYFDSIDVYQHTYVQSDLKSDSIVLIETQAGPISFVGTPSREVDVSTFEYIGLNPTTGFHIVKGRFWEHSEVYIIDDVSGHVDTLWSDPLFTRNDSLIVCKSLPYGLDGIPNGFQVWSLSDHRSWSKLLEVDQQEWIPLELKWIDYQTFLVKRMFVSDFWEHGGKPDSIQVVRYSLSDGG